MAKKFAAILSVAIAVLGFAGIVMGTGYIVNKHTMLENETPEAYESIIKRERKTGWASIGAGIGVMFAGASIYAIIADIIDQLDGIKSAMTRR